MNSTPATRSALIVPTRRQFVIGSAAALVAGAQAVSAGTFVQGSDEIRVGLVGCGGRGTGAAKDALRGGDGVRVVALGDLFEDKLQASADILQKVGDGYGVKDDARFVGFDAYQRVIHHPDVNYVILATPPGFRPAHFRETMEAGKHCFFEKPIAVDATGVRSVLDSGKIADAKKLCVVTGTIYRRAPNFVEGIKLLKDGAIGKPVSGFAYYMSGPAWVVPVPDGASPMEAQCRNWIHHPWLGGDHIVEQSVHNIDVLTWIFGPPKSAFATGGRIALVDPIFGPQYDHFSVEYVFDPDVRVQFTSRKFPGAEARVANRIICENGIADLNPGGSDVRKHNGSSLLKLKSEGNPYVGEHADLIAAIREGRHINETVQICESTLAAIMGRESAYSGQPVEWDWALNTSKQDYSPSELAMTATPPDVAIPVPGDYKLA